MRTLHGFFSAMKEKDAAPEDSGSGNTEQSEAESKQVNSLMVKTEVKEVEESDSSTAVQSLMVKSKIRDVFMCVVPVTIRSLEGVPHNTYALLDNGCTDSVMKDTVVDRLHTQAKPQTAEVGTMKDDPECLGVRETTVSVESRDGSFKFELENIVAVPPERFKMPSQPSPPSSKEPDFYTHLDDIDLNGVDPNQIEILIGADVAEAFIPRDVRRGRKDQPLAIKTVFGWTLFGKDRSSAKSNNVNVCLSTLQRTSTQVNKLWIDHGTTKKLSINTTYVHTPQKPDLETLVEKFWIQEHTGILPSRDVAMSVEDVSAAKKLETETKLVDGRYVVPMLWLNPAVKLLNNISLAQRRWKFLRKRFRSEPVLYAKYKGVVHGYVRDGKARRMSHEEASRTSVKTAYVPHHPVWNPHKPDKMRIVNDAAAEYGGMSLNKSLVTGPDLLNSLAGVLMCFRVGPIALVADIEAMFHQVRVPEDDADAQRFLWSDDVESDDPPYTMQMLVHMFGAKDSLTCAIYALQQTARDNAADFSPSTVETILRAFYVDDLLKSIHSEEAAIQLVKELIEILKRGGFRLTKWLSNSQVVLKSIPSSEVSPKVSVDLDGDMIDRALGITWNLSIDAFTFYFSPGIVINTKRGILRITSSLFDPLGFLIPFLLIAKMLLQMLWRHDLGWDDEITGELLDIWSKWLESAKGISAFKVDRCYFRMRGSVLKIQLHLFCDASESAYGTVAYL